jgi:hypothetical protein
MRGKKPDYKPLGEAALMMAVGLLSHHLPSRAMPGKSLITTDWKTYARIGLGLAAVQKINRAFNWKPPPWLGALEAVAAINPLTLGFSVASAAQAIIMAPLVSGSVHLAMLLNQAIRPKLPPENKWAPLLSQVLTSIGFAAVGLKLYPKIVKSIARQVAKAEGLPQSIRKGLSKLSKEGAVAAGASAVYCSRGCSMGSIICLSEAAELLGGFGTWMKSHLALNNTQEQKR